MPTADDILGMKRPEDLFKGDLDAAKRQYRELAKEWHPDHGKPRSTEVFPHINFLYDEAINRMAGGTWETEGIVRLEDQSKKGSYLVHYHIKSDFELGRFYVGDDYLTYVVDQQYKDLFDNAVKHISEFKYANKKMEDECSRYVPQKPTIFETPGKQLVMRVKKTTDLVLLRDVIRYYGEMDPKHAAWVLSSLYNLGCYLGYTGIIHQNISPDTYFISPKYHSGALLGSWWYAAKKGSKVSRLPTRTFNFLPWEARTKKKAIPLTDQELIRATGREMLGDISGVSTTPTSVPHALKEWLSSVATGSAIDNYTSWGEVLKESFGARRFTKMDLDAKTLYEKVR